MISTSSQAVKPAIADVLDQCYVQLRTHYQERLKDLILYGSSARNQMTDDSDIDLLVVLAAPVNYFNELSFIVELLYPIQLDSPYWISAKPAIAEEFESGEIQLYRNIHHEGLIYVPRS